VAQDSSEALPRVKYYKALKQHHANKPQPLRAASSLALTAFYECCSTLNLPPEQRKQQQSGNINLQHYHMGNAAAMELASGLRMIELPISRVNLSGNRIGRGGAAALLNTLKTEHLQELNFADNKIGARGVDVVCRLLGPDSQLRVLNLDNNVLGDRLVRLLAQCIGANLNSKLHELHLGKNKIAIRGAQALGQLLLIPSSTLQKLCLGWNEINGKAVTALAKGVETNGTLVSLDLSWNCFGGSEVGESTCGSIYAAPAPSKISLSTHTHSLMR
jgi:Ran GTPase-activating protein (RanGAP) involved in mRNA processing and transport